MVTLLLCVDTKKAFNSINRRFPPATFPQFIRSSPATEIHESLEHQHFLQTSPFSRLVFAGWIEILTPSYQSNIYIYKMRMDPFLIYATSKMIKNTTLTKNHFI
ncbi:hypothetical protein VE18_24450, partial [Enterobacter hormaechei]